jgi:serine phosphatase RsbU (regulator of sigma subunit)
MQRRNYILFFLLFALSYHPVAQNVMTEIDSMQKLLPAAAAKDRPGILNNLSKAHIRVNPYLVVAYADTALTESITTKQPDNEIRATNNLGIGHAMLGELDTSIYFFGCALELAEKHKDPKQYAYALDNMGNVLIYQNKYELALEKKQYALKIKEALKDEEGIITSLTNIATLFGMMGANDKAIEAYKTAAKKCRLTGDDYSLLTCYENLAASYLEKNVDDSSRLYIDSLIALETKMGFEDHSSFTYNVMAGLSRNAGDFKTAITYYEKEIADLEKRGNPQSLCNAYNNIGKTYIDNFEYGKAEVFLLKGLDLARQVDSKLRIYEAYHGLATVYHRMGRYKEAMTYYDLHIDLKDSVLNENINTKIAEMEARFQDEKVQLENQNLKKQQALDQLTIASNEAQAESEKQQKRLYAAGLVLAVILVVLVLIGFLLKKRDNAIMRQQKKEVEHQKEIVEEKNKEIFDSITYAKRIQEAILPPQHFIDALLPENFVLYKPKDIVAGDFYWMEHIGDTIILAAADCTGHGVPGAMVSVVCHNALNRSVREFGLTAPDQVLNKTRELVLETFARSGKNVNDGMDISLCAINRKTNHLKFAGANNDMIVLRKEELIELSADKQPVGKFDNAKPFSCQSLDLQAGDALYLFTDGFADQFGGEKGKKFKYQSFKKLLAEASQKPVSHQKDILHHAFESWKAEFEQLDDVCVIGVRV